LSPEEIKNITETLEVMSQILETKPNEWLPLYAALGGAVAGAITSFFPTLLLERSRENKLSRRLHASFLTEISALLEIIEHRNYRGSIKEVINHLKTQPAGTTHSLTVTVPEHYSRIYQENCKNIGVINEFYAKRIVIFHQLIDAIVQDIQPGGVVSKGAEIVAFEEMDKLFTRAMEVAHEIL
jgi:hypothetical protein